MVRNARPFAVPQLPAPTRSLAIACLIDESGSMGDGMTPGDATRTQFPRERKKQRNDPPERVFKVPPAREFSGNGNASLGTVNLSQAAIVKWTTKGRFELRFGREAFPIVAPSPSGQLIVPPYRFEQVRVIARGRWTIRIVPQK